MVLRRPLRTGFIAAIIIVVTFALFFVSCNIAQGGNGGAPKEKPTEAADKTTGEEVKAETPEPDQPEKPAEQTTETRKVQKTPEGFAKIGQWPWIIPYYTYDYYDYGKVVVSAYEYPEWETCGKLQNLEVVPAHNNQTIKPTGYDINTGYDVCRDRFIHSGCSPDHWYVQCPTTVKTYHTSFARTKYTGAFAYKEESEPSVKPEPYIKQHYGDSLIDCDSVYWCDTTVYCDTFDVGIVEFPMERELLLVVTLKENIPIKNAKVRWTFMDPKGARYCNNREKAVSVDIIKGAGVPENAAQLSRDQIITEFGDSPVYPMLPQTVDNLCDCSGAPVDKINISKNQSWVLIRGFEPGISKVYVNIVHPSNYTFPGMEYAVRWTRAIPPVHPDFDLRVNITENRPAQNDPFVFNDSRDKLVRWRITVVDETDYYINPTAAGILPIRYQVDYDMRFRRDPLQWDTPANWKDCYALFLDPPNEPNPETQYMNRLIWECKKQKAIPPAAPITLHYTRCVENTGNTFTHSAYSMFKAHQSTHYAGGGYSSMWGEDHYWVAKQQSVDVSLRYVECDKYRCDRYWNHITDESITLEYKPGEEATISGLEVFYNGTDANGDTWITLTNTGVGPVYEIYMQKPDGRKRAIAPFLNGSAKGGNVLKVREGYGFDADDNLPIQRGDWIWYYVYSTTNTAGTTGMPIVAQQKKVRVQ